AGGCGADRGVLRGGRVVVGDHRAVASDSGGGQGVAGCRVEDAAGWWGVVVVPSSCPAGGAEPSAVVEAHAVALLLVVLLRRAARIRAMNGRRDGGPPRRGQTGGCAVPDQVGPVPGGLWCSAADRQQGSHVGGTAADGPSGYPGLRRPGDGVCP